MIKNIFIFWDNGIFESPNVVKKCVISWKLNNPNWNIHILNNNNLSEYINNDELKFTSKKEITKAAFSDILRVLLLSKYGGCWCDATTFCRYSLDLWLNEYIKEGFFAFEMNHDRKISSWFIYSSKDCYMINKWKEKVVKYVSNVKSLGTNNIHVSIKKWIKNKYNYNHYFWFHYLFNDLYNNDNKFKRKWDLVKKYSSKIPSYLYDKLILDFNISIKNRLSKINPPILKLSYKYNKNKFNQKCVLLNIINSFELKFIHIPKTEGINIENSSKKIGLEWGANDKSFTKLNKKISSWYIPQRINGVCFCVIRCPYERVISEFYHQNISSKYNPNNLNDFIKTKINLINNSKNINIDDNHFRQQSKYFVFSKIAISFNNLQDNLNKVTDMFYLPRIILSKKNYIKENVKLTENDINDSNKILIKNLYKNDFRLWKKVKKYGIIIK